MLKLEDVEYHTHDNLKKLYRIKDGILEFRWLHEYYSPLTWMASGDQANPVCSAIYALYYNQLVAELADVL